MVPEEDSGQGVAGGDCLGRSRKVPHVLQKHQASRDLASRTGNHLPREPSDEEHSQHLYPNTATSSLGTQRQSTNQDTGILRGNTVGDTQPLVARGGLSQGQ